MEEGQEIKTTQEELNTSTNDMIKELAGRIPHIKKKEDNVNNVSGFQRKIKFIVCLEELEKRR